MRYKILNIGIILVVIIALTGIVEAKIKVNNVDICHNGKDINIAYSDWINVHLKNLGKHNGHDNDHLGRCNTQIPEFPTVALPIAAVIGLVFLFQQRKANGG